MKRSRKQRRLWRRAFARMEAGIALENANRCRREIAAIERGEFSPHTPDVLRGKVLLWRKLAREALRAVNW